MDIGTDLWFPTTLLIIHLETCCSSDASGFIEYFSTRVVKQATFEGPLPTGQTIACWPWMDFLRLLASHITWCYIQQSEILSFLGPSPTFSDLLEPTHF